jgi:hypothetical protein
VGQTGRIGNTQLTGQIAYHITRNLRGLNQKSPQEPNRAQLNGKSEAIVWLTTPCDMSAIDLIEMEILGELGGSQITGVPTVALFLDVRQKANGHSRPRS